MRTAIDTERSRASHELERSRAELATSLDVLKTRAREAVSPSRVLQAHLGWAMIAAFALGLGLARVGKGG